MFNSDFCSGNLARAQRGYLKNSFDLWVASDASPHMESEYYRTWFYFSVTGVPAGEMLTFTFKNLSNQVSNLDKIGLRAAPQLRLLRRAAAAFDRAV